MKPFKCSDLDKFLGRDDPEGQEALRAHAAGCRSCAEEVALWEAISINASSLRKEWDSPALWSRIEGDLAKMNAKASRPRVHTGWWSALQGSAWALSLATMLVFFAASVVWVWVHFSSNIPPPRQPFERRLLTERAFEEVKAAEDVYLKSIEKLASLVEPRIQSADSPLLVNYREKLLLIDSAIEDLRGSIEQNRFNAHLRMELLSMYREKQNTLEELSREYRQ